jgi:hypothetical protein
MRSAQQVSSSILPSATHSSRRESLTVVHVQDRDGLSSKGKESGDIGRLNHHTAIAHLEWSYNSTRLLYVESQ